MIEARSHRKRMALLGNVGALGPLVHELRSSWHIVGEINPFYLPLCYKFRWALRSISLRPQAWKHQYSQACRSYNRSADSYRRRSLLCQWKLDRFNKDYDVALQFGSSFFPWEHSEGRTYAVYVDRTLRMNEQFFPEMVAQRTVTELDELYKMQLRVFNTADIVFTFNDVARDSVVNGYGVDCKKVITVGAGVNATFQENLQKESPNTVLAVCSDFKRHDGKLTIDAFVIAKEKNPNARFVFVGDRACIRMNGIEFTDRLSYESLLQLYEQASVVVMPSPLGGLRTLTDGMAAECACIASAHNPYVGGLISDGENGCLFSKREPTEIAGLITALLHDAEMRKSMGARAREHILTDFTWASVASKITSRLLQMF